jgi:hypothetical protein
MSSLTSTTTAAVPSLRALAFNRLVERYGRLELAGRENEQTLMLFKLPVTLLPEFMRRKAAFEAVDAATDAKELMWRFGKSVAKRNIKHVAVECQICDHTFEIDVTVGDEQPARQVKAMNKEIKDVQHRKRQKLNEHCLLKPICANYGFDDTEAEEQE